MADDELDAIRARRMAELQAGGGGQNQPSPEEQAERQRQMSDMKNSILSQVLDQSARARLNTISIAKPEKAKMIEGMLMQMAQSGQIQNKLGEDQLKGLLEKVSERTNKKTTVKFKRRGLDDSDDEFQEDCVIPAIMNVSGGRCLTFCDGFKPEDYKNYKL